MHLKFEDVITSEWFATALESGVWDPEHGSDIGHVIEGIQAGDWDFAQCPAKLQNIPVGQAIRDADMIATLKEWLRGRFAEVVEYLPTANAICVQRLMQVDQDWIAGLVDGTSTTGIYFGGPYMDMDGGYWLDEGLPHLVVMKAVVKATDVDWKGTILARMDHMTGDREEEVRLFENVTVDMLSIEIDGVKLSQIPATMSTGVKRGRASSLAGPKI